LLLGDSTSGEKVTLLKAFNRSTDNVFANAVIVGFHADRADPLISTTAVVFRHLDEWWDRAAISPDVSLGWPNLTLQYKEPDPIVVYEDSVLRISVRSGLTGSHKRMEHSLKEEIHHRFSSCLRFHRRRTRRRNVHILSKRRRIQLFGKSRYGKKRQDNGQGQTDKAFRIGNFCAEKLFGY